MARGKSIAAGSPCSASSREHRPAGVPQAEHLRDLVERLTRRIVERLAQRPVDAPLGHVHERGVAARYDQRDQGGATSGSANMLAKMWPSRWFTPTSGSPVAIDAPFAYASPTTSAPTSPGPLRHREGVERRERQRSARAQRLARLRERLVDHADDRLGVLAARDLRHDPAEPGMEVDLARDHARAASSRPPRMTAAAVSSHDVSIARMSSSVSRSTRAAQAHEVRDRPT